MMFWPNLLLAKALRSRVALSSLMSATKETTASEPLPVVVEVMVIEPSLAVRLWPLTFTPVSSLGLAVAEPEALAFACAAAAS